MSAHARGVVRGLLLAAWFGVATLAVVAIAGVAPFRRDRGARLRAALFRGWSRGTARIVGLRVEVAGPLPAGPFLLVANHLSYLDVIVLGATLRATFVAKADVATWPLIGWLCSAVGTVFIDRTRKRDLLRVLPILEERLRGGGGVVVFPESTTGDGSRVLPFRSPLFAAATRTRSPVHVATLTYTTPAGTPHPSRSVCWWGDMDFLPHLLGVLRLPSCAARLALVRHPIHDTERKRLARATERAIARRFVPVSWTRERRLPVAAPPASRGEESMPAGPVPAAANVQVLRQGADLLSRLDDAVYRHTVGPQLRHTLDFYASFLRGLPVGRVDYDTRERDPLVESSRRIARERCAHIITALEEISPEDTARPLEVRTEAETLAPGEPEWSPSSVRRELQFLLSHTVHHNALVKELLRARGHALDDAFGVAPSTLAHRTRFACAR